VGARRPAGGAWAGDRRPAGSAGARSPVLAEPDSQAG